MKYTVSFNIKKGYAYIDVDAESAEEAENIAWQNLMYMTVGELRKLEADMESDTE